MFWDRHRYRIRWRSAVVVGSIVLGATSTFLLDGCGESPPPPSKPPQVKTWKESLEDAERCLVCRDYGGAESNYKIALEKIEPPNSKVVVDPSTVVEVQANLALALAKQEKIDESQPYTEKVIKYVESVRLNEDQSEILTVIDKLCDEYVRIARDGETAKDRVYLEEALKLQHLCHVGNSMRGVNLMTDLAISNIRAKNMSEAKRFIATSMKYAVLIPNRDFTHHMVALLKVSVALDRVGEKTEAQKIYKFVDNLYNERFGQRRKAHMYERLGSALYEYGDYDRAIENLKLGIDEAKRYKFSMYDIARSYVKVALAYEKRSDQTNADKSFQSAIDIVMKPNMTEEEKRLAFEIINSYVPYLKRQKRTADADAWKAKGDLFIQHMFE